MTSTRNLYSAAVRDTVPAVNMSTDYGGHTKRDEERSRKRYEHGRKNETRGNGDGFTLVGNKKKTLNKKAIIFIIIYYLNIFIQGRTFSVYTVLQCVPVNAITIKRRYIMQVIL